MKYFSKILLFFIVVASVKAQTEWKFSKQKDKIKVYTRDVGNKGFKELRTLATFTGVDLHQIFAAFKDVPASAEWSANCKYGKCIKVNSLTDYYNYFVINAPWPVKDRDVIYHSRVYFDLTDTTLHIRAQAQPDMMPEVQGMVRVLESYGYWKIKRHHTGIILIENLLHADPRGFPAWLVNLFAVDAPIVTVSNLEKQAKKDKYQSAYFDFIQDGKGTSISNHTR